VPVLTQHYDNRRTGANLAETKLSPATVSPATFGKLFELAVEGHVYAQPLYVDDVDVPGVGPRNVLYVATMHNRLYAFNADSGAVIWSLSLGPYVSLPDANIGPPDYKDIADAIGILGTPVISADKKLIYVVAMTHEGSQYYHRLHALDLATGQHRLGGPVAIQGTVSGTGDGSANPDNS
jgi:outer membrane protein assembly factor BamB